jgi:hypothetical protein
MAQENGWPMNMTGEQYIAWVRDLTPAQEAEILARIKAEVDPVAMEVELRDLLEQRKRGELQSFDDLLRDVFGIAVQDEKDPA